MSRTIGVVVAACWMVLAACSEGAGPEQSSGVRLEFGDGAVHEAAGDPVLAGGELQAATFAAAFADSVGGLVIASFEAGADGVGDLFVLQLVTAAEGDHGPCGTGGDCHGRILEALDVETLVAGSYWEIVEGGVTVESLGDRATGRFTDLGMEDGSGATRTVVGGTFDLPLLTQEEGVALMQCFLQRVTGGDCD